jgi:hypothetical protein
MGLIAEAQDMAITEMQEPLSDECGVTVSAALLNERPC